MGFVNGKDPGKCEMSKKWNNLGVPRSKVNSGSGGANTGKADTRGTTGEAKVKK